LVKNGKIITGPTSLPKTWKNMQGFDLDPKNAKKYGWIPAIVDNPVIPNGYRKGGRKFYMADEVIHIIYDMIKLVTPKTKTTPKHKIKNDSIIPDYPFTRSF